MKKRIKWKRVYNPIIGVRFFDTGKYALGGYFTIEKLWWCQIHSKSAENLNGLHWFWLDRMVMQIRTDEGLVYKMPFFPWMEVYDESGKKSLADYYKENSFMAWRKSWQEEKE